MGIIAMWSRDFERYNEHSSTLWEIGKLGASYSRVRPQDHASSRVQHCHEHLCSPISSHSLEVVAAVKPTPLTPIPVSDPFDRVGVDAVQLPVSDRGNKYAAAFIDYMSKWPEVYAVPDQS